jgi:hypothetical protein
VQEGSAPIAPLGVLNITLNYSGPCPGGGTAAVTGAATFTDDTADGYGTFRVQVSGIDGTFTDCSDWMYSVDGTVTLSADNSITRTLVNDTTDEYKLAANETFRGQLDITDLAGGGTYPVNFSYKARSRIEFTHDSGPPETFTITRLVLSVETTVNGQSCVFMVNSDTQQQATWSCATQ